jgi:hypothetical protein
LLTMCKNQMIVQPLMRVLVGLILAAIALFAQFEYDGKQPYDTTCQPLGKRNDSDLRGCGFTGLAEDVSTSFWSSPAASNHHFQE